jgi:hypothetical protein
MPNKRRPPEEQLLEDMVKRSRDLFSDKSMQRANGHGRRSGLPLRLGARSGDCAPFSGSPQDDAPAPSTVAHCGGLGFRNFDLNGEARAARTKQSGPIIPPAWAIPSRKPPKS